jgi:hypothetical protein
LRKYLLTIQFHFFYKIKVLIDLGLEHIREEKGFDITDKFFGIFVKALNFMCLLHILSVFQIFDFKKLIPFC